MTLTLWNWIWVFKMIIVIEGMSAAGKTTWCKAQEQCAVVWETFPEDRDKKAAYGIETAQYWTDWNKKRWAEAIAIEMQSSLAICDTDPLKLHYCWALWQIGQGSREQWEMQRDATRAAIADRSLGFADYVFVKPMEEHIVRRQRELDPRVRDRFEVHLQMQGSLIAWYQALQKVTPERVVFEHPESLNAEGFSLSRERYSMKQFDRFVSLLPMKG